MQGCKIARLQDCKIATSLYTIHLTFPYSHLPQKKFSPFPLSFSKYIVAKNHLLRESNSIFSSHSDTLLILKTESGKHFQLPSNIIFTSKLQLMLASKRLFEKISVSLPCNKNRMGMRDYPPSMLLGSRLEASSMFSS